MKPSDELALPCVSTAIAYGRENGVAIAAAVVDSAGHLLAFGRADDAMSASIEVSQVNAATAVYFQSETRHLPFDKPFTPALLGAVSQPFAFVAGGIPLRSHGVLLGAIGVGGRSAEQDKAAATAGADTIPNTK